VGLTILHLKGKRVLKVGNVSDLIGGFAGVLWMFALTEFYCSGACTDYGNKNKTIFISKLFCHINATKK